MAQVLADYRSDGDKFEPQILLRISKQLLKAVDFIHSSGLCHGDISARNIAFTCKSISRGTEDELFEILGFPEHEPLSRIDGAPLEVGLPKHLVKAAEWDEWIEEEEEDIRILDFGESFFQGQEPEKLAQPGSHRVPETIFTDSFGYRVDLWRTGCMIYSFVFAAWPFWYLGDDEVLVHQMIGLVGKLPDEWEAKWESVLKGSKHDLGPDGDFGGTKLEQRLDELETTLKPLCDVIQGLMRFQPARRIAAGDALDMLGHG